MSQLKGLTTRAPEELNKRETKEKTEGIIDELRDLQNRLYATSRYSLLVIIQGMDASGKDGAIANVIGKLNPQGFGVKSFKVPTEEENKHDFLWRVHPHVPARGMISVFNRSHYESVLVTRVHGYCDDATAKRRFRAINEFESLLMEDNETRILKFYLHVSPEAQLERLEERKVIPSKRWKHNPKDFEEMELRDRYQQMYEDVFHHCNTPPWIIVPADQNWYKEHLIASAIANELKSLGLEYPEPPEI